MGGFGQTAQVLSSVRHAEREFLGCVGRGCGLGVRGYRAGVKRVGRPEETPPPGALLAAVFGPARRRPQSVGETGKGPITDLHVFANGGSVERGGPPAVKKPSWRGGGGELFELRPEDGGMFGDGAGAVGWLAQGQQ